MPEGAEPLLMTSEIRKRVQRFASLRAAQRALNRSLHPSELALANQQGRRILIELQALSSRAEEAERSTRSEREQANDRDALHRLDLLLRDISLRTRELLESLEISHLRSTAPLIAAQHPDEVRGLIDLLLEGDLEDDKNLRMLEYLITVLSSEERDGRRILVRKPNEVSPQLREVARRQLADGDAEYLVAEKIFDNTMGRAHGDPEIGAIRDRIRRYKEGLGSRILHPRILGAAVSYNVAMWNRVAGLVDGGRSIDCLADDLFGIEPTEAGPESGPPPPSPSPPAHAPDVLASKGFDRIVSALRDRLGRRPVSDELAKSVIAAYELDSLADGEREAFAGEGEIAQLTRRAVALGLTIRHEAQVNDLLHALRVDPEQLRTLGVERLKQEMSELARKLFAQGRHDEAFRLSEVKTRHLPAVAATAAGAATSAAGRARGRGGLFHVDWGLPAGQAWAALLLLMLPLIAALVWSTGKGVSLIPAEDLSHISPFLESGYRTQGGERTEFVGRLNRGWDYLGRSERLRVTAEIGLAFKSQGIHHVVLQDQWEIVQARYVDGSPVLESLPQLAPPPLIDGNPGTQGAWIEHSATTSPRSPIPSPSKSKQGS